MRTIKTIFAGALALIAATIAFPTSALAQTIVTGQQTQSNNIWYQTQQVSATYTNSTTTASDVTDLSVTVPASIIAPGYQFVEACYTVQASKATATTGSTSLLVNGVAQASAGRTIPVTTGATMAACHYVARPTAAAFAVTVRGVSGDTNAFTITQGSLSVRVFFVQQ